MQRRLNIILALGLVYLLLTWALGSSFKGLCAATSKNDVRNCSTGRLAGSRHCSYVHLELLPPFTLLLRKNSLSFYLSEFQVLLTSLLWEGKAQANLSATQVLYAYSSASLSYLLYIVNANCPTFLLWFAPEGVHVDSSQLALEFSIRTARSSNQIISKASSNLTTRLCKLLRPNTNLCSHLLEGRGTTYVYSCVQHTEVSMKGFLLSGSPRSSTSKTRFGLMLVNSQAWFPHSA